MVEGQLFHRAPAVAILAEKTVAQKDVKAGKSRAARKWHILAKRNDAGNLKLAARRMYRAVIVGDHVDAIKERSFHRVLPRPYRQRKVTERPIIRVQDQRKAAVERGQQSFLLRAVAGNHVPKRRSGALRQDVYRWVT